MIASTRALLAGVSLALAIAAPPARAEPDPPAPQPPASAAQGTRDAADGSERARNELARMETDMRRRLRIIEDAKAMLDRGESPAAVSEFLKSKNMGVMARMFEERRRGPAAGPGGPRGLGVRDRSSPPMRRRPDDRDGAGPPGEARDGPGHPPPPLVTVEERQVIRDVLRELMPQRVAEFDRLMREDAPAAEREFMELMASPRIRSLLELRRTNPEAFRSRVEEFKAASEGSRHARAVIELQARSAPAREIEAARAALRAAAERQFDMRVAGLSLEIERLADRAASLRSELDHQNARRSEFIDRAVEDAIERARRGPPRDDERPRQGPAHGPGGPDRPR